jgi:uncharacterized protein with HEPN domain
MSESTERRWQLYLDDMLTCAERVIAYTVSFDQAGFIASQLHVDATVRNLELIGEAATHIPVSVRETYPKIPWRMIIATRNRLIHGYLGIDHDLLWSIIRTDIPVLLPQLRHLRDQAVES